MNVSLTDELPDEDAPFVTTTPPVIEVPERLTNAQRKAIDHMARLQREKKPSIITLYWNGRGWQLWVGVPAGNVVG